MAQATQTEYSKPPRYSADEMRQRRQAVGAGLMAMYKAYGWRQPIADEWMIEVSAWASGLAFVPTEDLLSAFGDALAQPDAPRPLNLEYVKRVYNGIPNQGLAYVAHESHLLFAAPKRLLALPAPAGDPQAQREAAAAVAESATAVITDPELRRVFQRLIGRAMLPPDLRKEAVAAGPGAVFGARASGYPTPAQKPTNGRDYLEAMRASNNVPDWLREAVSQEREKANATADTNDTNNDEAPEGKAAG